MEINVEVVDFNHRYGIEVFPFKDRLKCYVEMKLTSEDKPFIHIMHDCYFDLGDINIESFLSKDKGVVIPKDFANEVLLATQKSAIGELWPEIKDTNLKQFIVVLAEYLIRVDEDLVAVIRE